MTSNMITYPHFLLLLFLLFLVFEFKSKFTYKYLINNIINQVVDQFCFESRPNNTSMSSSFENIKFGQINLTLNIHTNTFSLKLMKLE